MTARSVLLAIAEASFLRGDEPLYPDGDGREGSTGKSGKAGSLAQRWRECDQRAQLSLASANPQVGNLKMFDPRSVFDPTLRPVVAVS